MSKEFKPLSQITHEAFRILAREIGLSDTLRFINQFGPGYGNYAEERKELFKDLTLDDILKEMRGKNQPPLSS